MHLYNEFGVDTKSLKKVYTILKLLGIDFEEFLVSKRERIKFQKLVYALQRNGFLFGYNYNLYLNGPYSPSLADDGYYIARNLNDFENETEKFEISDIAYEKIERTKKYLNNNLSDVDWLETIATIDFLYNELYLHTPTKEKVFSKFIELKPHLNKLETLEIAWKVISGGVIHDN